MNCDEAFDAITDADGRNTDQFRWHLDRCPRCRQMQQVLEPALALFDSAADQGPADGET